MYFALFIYLFFFWCSVIGDALVKEVVVALPSAALGVEKKPSSGGVAREARQVIKDGQPLLSPISLAV